MALACQILHVPYNHGGRYSLRIEVGKIFGEVKTLNIYCNETPSKVSSCQHKVCSICVVGEDINIYPHENGFMQEETVYHLVKDNIDEIISLQPIVKSRLL